VTRWRVGRQLRSVNYDQAIILPRSFKAALVPWFAGIPIRTGYRGENRYAVINDMRPLDKSVLTQTVQRYTALGLAKGATLPPPIRFPHLRVDQQKQQQLIRQLGLQTDKPVIAMMPGAEYGPAKQWPVDHFQQLASQLTQQGNRVWLFGSGKEQSLGDDIAVNTDIVNLCGRTQLEDVIDLMACCETAVTNDSGLMHIAAATGVRVIVIYGSSTPDYTPPLTDKAEIVYHRLECSPCFARTCRYKHYDCLQGVGVNEIMEKIK
jgi:heptosyltransferase-2